MSTTVRETWSDIRLTINRINLTLKTNCRRIEIQTGYQFLENLIYLDVFYVWNDVTWSCNKWKHFGKLIKRKFGLQLLVENMLIFFKTAQKPFSHYVAKCSSDRLRYKIYLRSGGNFVERPLIIVPGVPASATDWEGLRGHCSFGNV